MNDQNNFNNNIYNSQGAHQGCAPVSNSNSNFNSNMQNNNLNNYQTYQNSGSVQSNNNGFINQNVSQTTDVSSNYLNANNVQGNGVVNNNSNVINVNNIMKSLDNNVYEEKPKSKIKIFLLLFFIIVIVVTVVYFVFFRNNTNAANLNVVFDIDKPILVFNGDKKCGYFDFEGSQIIDFKYDNGTQFYNGYAGVIVDDANEEYRIIDLEGNEIVKKTGGEKPQYLIDYDIWVLGDSFYNNKIELISPENYSVTYSDNGLFIFKDYEKNETGVINYKNEVLYSMYGTEGVEIDISHSNYDVDELFLKVKTPESVVVVSTLTDDLVYTHEEASELYAYEDGFFYTLSSNGKRDFKYFHNGRFIFYWEGVDYVHIADYEKQIVFAEFDGNYRYYNINEDYQLSGPHEKNEYFEFLNGSNYYDYEFYECGAGKGLKKKDDIILECGYSDIKYLNINLFNYLKIKKFKEIILLDDYSSLIIYDLSKNKKINSFEMTDFESYNDSILVKIVKSDNTGYIIYNLYTDNSVEINGENIDVDIYSNYYTVLNRNKLIYYNADFEMIYDVEVN